MQHFEIYRSGVVRREWRWRMRAANGRIIANGGEGFHNHADCLSSIRLFRDLAPGAPIKDDEHVKQLRRPFRSGK